MKVVRGILGGVFLVIGGISLLNNIGLIHYQLAFWKFWPLLILIPGLVFEYQYFSNKAGPDYLVPGGMFITYGILFMYCSFWGYHTLAYLWPVFIGGIGVGLFQLYYFGKEEKDLLFVALSFIGFAVFALFFAILNIKGNIILPLILILAGGRMLLKPKISSDQAIITEDDKS